jgi:hypothetical protein
MMQSDFGDYLKQCNLQGTQPMINFQTMVQLFHALPVQFQM